MTFLPLLALCLLPQSGSADARLQAGAWLQSPPAPAALRADWDAADSNRRTLFLEAAALHKGAAGLVVLAAAMEDPAFRKRPRWQQTFHDIALLNDELPGTGLLADDKAPALLRYRALLDRGWLPAADSVATCLADPQLREPLLRAWAAQPTLAATDRTPDTASWPAYDRMLWELLLAQEDPSSIAERASGWVAELTQGNYLVGYRQPALDLLTALAPALPADAFLATWSEMPLAMRTYLMPALQDAPAAAAWQPLRSVALETLAGIPDRAAAVRRLFALDGPRAADELLTLLGPGVPAPLLQALLLGLRTSADEDACAAIEAGLSGLPSGILGNALEVLTLRGDERQSLLWERNYPVLEMREKRAVLRAALFREQDGLQDRLWETVNGPPGEDRTAAEAALREFLKEPALVAGFERGLASMPDPAQRLEQLQRIARLRTDEATAAVRRALQDSALAQEPMGFVAAARLLEDEAARPLFEAWWSDPAKAGPNLRYVAALALAGDTHPECEDYVRAQYLEVDQGLLLATVSTYRDRPDPGRLAAARAWLWDMRLPDVIRREWASNLVLALGEHPHARFEALAALQEAAARLRVGAPFDAPMAALIQGCFDRGDEGVRDYVDRILRMAKRAGAPSAAQMDARIDQYRAAFGRPGYSTEELLVQLAAGLRNPAPAAPADAEPSIPPIAERFSGYHSLLVMLAARPTEEVEPAVRALLESEPGAWHPDLLWLTARRMERPQPDLVPIVEAALAAIEPVGSLRVPRPSAAVPLPARDADAQRYFQRLDDAVMSGHLDEAEVLLEAGRIRHPEDRRMEQWYGWVLVARGDLDGAEAAFRRADALGGPMPYMHMEQTLGLAVVAELRDGSSPDLERFLDYEEQAAGLLRARLPVTARPDLAFLLPPEPTAGD